MELRAYAANLLWLGAGVTAWRRYRAALRDPLCAQGALLHQYLQRNESTVFGVSHGFSGILATARGRTSRMSVASMRDLIGAYQAQVPMSSYDDFEPLINRVAAGERGVLTTEQVRRLAPSSGSTAATKLVPYTAGLQRELSEAVDAWIADLFLRRPGLMRGPAYWSITPGITGVSPRATSKGDSTAVPIGFDDDSAYLGGARQAIAQAVLAVPDAVRFVSDPDAFRYVTLVFLARVRDLRLISVWHPSFLTRLLEALPASLEQIVEDIRKGTLSPPNKLDPRVRATLKARLRPDARRAEELKSHGRKGVMAIWPKLELVSCWADGAAQPHADDLARALAPVELQPKGLIATEAIVTIPFGLGRPVAVTSHFVEFIDSAGRPHLTCDLERGSEYSVVITTAGGLYRYRLGDRVVVDGWIESTPSLRFVGKDDSISDWFGEKLSDGFVAGVLPSLFRDLPRPRFAMLAPERLPSGVAYTLFIETAAAEEVLPAVLAQMLERELRRNPHYAWCVDLGQLRPARVVRVAPGADRAYVDACVARGRRIGDVKPVSLHCDSGWEARLGHAAEEVSC